MVHGDEDAALRIVADRRPIHIDKATHAKIIIAALRQCAADFRQNPRRVMETKLRAGKLIIEAQQSGLAPPIEGLAELVAFHTSAPTVDAKPRQATLVRCPENLFSGLAGGGLIDIRKVGGKVEVVGEPYGGLMPRISAAIGGADRNAATCEALAALIESSANSRDTDDPYLPASHWATYHLV